MRVCVYACMRVCVYAYVYVYVYMYVYVYVYVHVYVCGHVATSMYRRRKVFCIDYRVPLCIPISETGIQGEGNIRFILTCFRLPFHTQIDVMTLRNTGACKINTRPRSKDRSVIFAPAPLKFKTEKENVVIIIVRNRAVMLHADPLPGFISPTLIFWGRGFENRERAFILQKYGIIHVTHMYLYLHTYINMRCHLASCSARSACANQIKQT